MSGVRPFEPGEWELYRALRLRALGDSPDAFGSTLEREEAFEASAWESRLAAGCASSTDLPLVAVHDGAEVGLAWGRIEPESPERANLYQMWVAP
ncbi:MAG: GNAT family N-acetyltransferase, partial [Myxococcota bacterium]|nr:GNAT family N-acetyltransferase [Myxococcota bacterium]